MIDFTAYEAAPGISVILQPDAPLYTLAAVSKDFLKAINKKKQEVIGRSFFEVFSKNMAGSPYPADTMLKASFAHVDKVKASNEIPVLRYDLPLSDGTIAERYWQIKNAPILDEKDDLLYIIHSMTEITSQAATAQNKEGLKSIEQQNQELLFVMDFMPQMVWYTHPDGSADFFNRVYLDYAGLTTEQLTGQQWTALLHPEDIETTGKVWKQALASGEGYEVEHRLRGKDGVYRWFLTRGRALKDDTGAVLKWYGTTTDIHEHKVEEELLEQRVREKTAALENQRNVLDNILKHSPAGITLYKAIRDKEDQIIDFQCNLANNAAEAYTGISNKDRLSKTVLEITPGLKETPLYRMAVSALESGTPFRNEYYNSDLKKWLELSVVKMDDNCLINVFRDISPVKEIQFEIERTAERFKAVFNASQTGMFTFSPVRNGDGVIIDFRFVVTNPNFAAYIGKIPADLDGELGSTWFPGYLTNGVFDMYKKTYLTGETLRIDIHYNVDQHDIYLDLQSTKIGDEVLVTFNDYTTLKKTQLQLEKTIEELKQSNVNLEEFAYAASHDLKEPVRKIQVFTDRLKTTLQGQLSDEQDRFFERVEFAAKRMSTLIEDLLQYSYITKGATFEKEVNLNDKVALVLQDLDLEIEQKGALVKVEPLPVITAHRRQLQQLFHNLIGNALKYSRPGVPPEVHISASTVKGSETPLQLTSEHGAREYHLISVRDNGIGFEQKDAGRIFHLFTRLHGNAEYRGSGVGLSIVHRIVENHHGFIWAEGKSGAGATFNILLPK